MREVNPWGNELVDYDKLFEGFGLQKVTPAMRERFKESASFRRGLIFAHRDLDRFAKKADEGRPVAVLSGIKPSNSFHLGSKLTAEEIIFFQRHFKAKAYYCIADLEAYADNGLSLEQGHEIAVDNVADLLALGLDERNAVIYKQSANAKVLRLAHIFSKHVTISTLESLYGHQNLGLYTAVLTQAGDILYPMLKEEGAEAVLVPVGADQDPHIRLTRDIAQKFSAEGFTPPAATFHKFFRALNGETKMSKRDPMNVISLTDSPDDATKKVRNALTGGRDTAEEQRKKGGLIGKCVVYELMQFHFYADDRELKRMHDECTSGKILCGECKNLRIEKIKDYLKEHQHKKNAKLEKARKLVEAASG
ncbi:MAG: tryptophan--tRNA ligase [Candidatus Micrarchaeota archaeon]